MYLAALSFPILILSTVPSESIKTSLVKILDHARNQPVHPVELTATPAFHAQPHPWELNDGLYVQSFLVTVKRETNGDYGFFFLISLQVLYAIHRIFSIFKWRSQNLDAATYTALETAVAPFLDKLSGCLSHEKARYREAGRWDLGDDYSRDALARFVADFLRKPVTNT